jgi:phenylpyruvate tautomerase PptA (4-oxalocrotonate tautomerase family)
VPFTRVSIPTGTSAKSKQAIAESVHRGMVQAIGIPEDDFFQLLSEYHLGDFFFDRQFLGVSRSEALIVVHITLRRGRSDAMKRDLYAQITANLKGTAGVRAEDVFIYLSENDFSDWSVGAGKMSMAIVQQPESMGKG